jgi:hypothetical protein
MYFFVHFSFLGSRFSSLRFFLHLEEHVHCIDPSLRISNIPWLGGICFPQKEQLRKEVADLLIN